MKSNTCTIASHFFPSMFSLNQNFFSVAIPFPKIVLVSRMCITAKRLTFASACSIFHAQLLQRIDSSVSQSRLNTLDIAVVVWRPGDDSSKKWHRRRATLVASIPCGGICCTGHTFEPHNIWGRWQDNVEICFSEVSVENVAAKNIVFFPEK